jgi:hypothetical protein
MTDRELLQMALGALSLAVEPKKGKVYAPEFQPIDCAAMHLKAIEALRARLAQPEQVIQARKEGDLIVVDLPQVPTGSCGISKDAQPEPVAQFEFQNYGWWRDEEGRLQLGTQPQGE